MSGRSRREHKPTSKFLNFYTTEFIHAEETRKQRVSKNQATCVNTPIVSTPKNVNRRLSIKKSSATTNGKLLKDEAPILDESLVASPSSEIRRSNRQHKPNQKLKEYLQSSHDDRRSSGAGVPSASPVQSKGKKLTPELGRLKCSTKKSVATISPMIRQEGIEAPIMGSKNISVELVDCFEALARDLAKTHPVTKTENTTLENTGVRNQSSPNLVDVSSNGSWSKSNGETSDEGTGHVSTPRVAKRPLDDESRSLDEPLSKQQRLAPSVVRNLTRTKKLPEVIAEIETVHLDTPLRRKKSLKRVTRNNRCKVVNARNNRCKVVKQYPLRQPSAEIVSPLSLPSTHSSPTPRHTPRHTPRQQPQRFLQQSTTSPSPHYRRKKQVENEQQQDIKETLKKFLIMGTKVANAISETLKHNEEALLTKSSAFEKKCLSLVHALAKQGADLEEEDMEKVLKLLDEEQEERRLYRHTFLESLRVSHLTNMALYNQMLRLLKTL